MTCLEEQRKIATEFLERMQENHNVEGVMFLGSLARNYADKYSDIDVAVFSKSRLKGLKVGEQLVDGWDLEVFNISMDKGFDNWSEIKREAYAEGKIVFDRTGEVSRFITNALEYKDEYKMDRIVELVYDLAWHGWVYSEYRDEKVKGYHWILPEDLWFKREYPENAMYLGIHCTQLLMELAFAVYKKWTPDYKWRWIRINQIDDLPENIKHKFKYLLLGEWNEETWNDKRQDFQYILDELFEMIEKEFPEESYEYLLNI